MCIDPVSATLIATAATVGTSMYGASQQAAAQQQAADALGKQNIADMQAQAQGFQQRMAATQAQTQAQEQAFGQTMGNEQQIADTMRQQQQAAMTGQQNVLAAENQQEDVLQGQGNAAAANLVGQTSGANLDQAQSGYQSQAENLLGSSGLPVLGPQATDPSAQTGAGATDPVMAQALARRAAQAATNIRAYGSKIAKAGSYGAPLNLIANASTDTATNIMPAQQAASLLRSGSDIRLMPSSQLYQNAGQYADAATRAAQQQGQSALNVAGLQYQNSTDIANLQQGDITQNAANAAAQAKANAEYQLAMANVISGIGNLGATAVGRYGVVPDFLKPTPIG